MVELDAATDGRCDMIDIGRMRYRVRVQRPRHVADSYGDQRIEWEDVDTRWATLVPARAEERFRGQRTEGVVTHNVWMRYVPWLTHGHRLVYDGGRYEPAVTDGLTRLLGVAVPASDLDDDESTVADDPRVFEIEELVDVDNRHRMLLCKCVEVVP